jgi:transcription elongation factor
MPFTVPRNLNDNLRKRKRHLEQLAALPFNPTVIQSVHGPDALKQRGNSYIFENKTFRNSMLILNVQSLHTLDPIPFPSLREIQPFLEAGFLTHEAALHMTLHEELARIQPGDRVVLIAGEKEGFMAMVIAVEDYMACVDIIPIDEESDGPSHLTNVPIHHMQRILHIGTHVCVRNDAEELTGSSGHIVALSEDKWIVNFIESKTGTSVSFFKLKLHKRTDPQQIHILARSVETYVPDFFLADAHADALSTRTNQLVGRRILISGQTYYKGYVSYV